MLVRNSKNWYMFQLPLKALFKDHFQHIWSYNFIHKSMYHLLYAHNTLRSKVSLKFTTKSLLVFVALMFLPMQIASIVWRGIFWQPRISHKRDPYSASLLFRVPIKMRWNLSNANKQYYSIRLNIPTLVSFCEACYAFNIFQRYLKWKPYWEFSCLTRLIAFVSTWIYCKAIGL